MPLCFNTYSLQMFLGLLIVPRPCRILRHPPFDCISMHIVQRSLFKYVVCLGSLMQSGFIRADQTWRTFLVSWRPNNNSHFFPVLTPFLDSIGLHLESGYAQTRPSGGHQCTSLHFIHWHWNIVKKKSRRVLMKRLLCRAHKHVYKHTAKPSQDKHTVRVFSYSSCIPIPPKLQTAHL